MRKVDPLMLAYGREALGDGRNDNYFLPHMHLDCDVGRIHLLQTLQTARYAFQFRLWNSTNGVNAQRCV